jgi:Ca-activated chloride channel family protein
MLLGVGSAFVLAAPQQTVAPPVLSARTDLVTMAATVVDRRGRPVTGLIRDNFVVYDNGERRPIEFFTNEDVAATIGLVIDRSASMRARRDDVAAAAAAFATASNPLDEFFTVNFNESVWPGLPADVAFTQDTNLLRAVLLAAPARGMTALYDAIDRALDHLPLGTRDRKALIVVSDGGDNASAHSLGEVLARARTTNAVIYSVAFVDPDDHDAKPQVLRRLARETGGRAFSPGTPVEMATAFAQIAREIRAGYTIGFSPPESVDQGYRVIRVVADAGDRRALIVRTRAGYYADASGPVVR